jgi:recombination protein RecT
MREPGREAKTNQSTTEEPMSATVPTKQEDKFPVMLQAYKAEIARALPKHLNPDRLCRIALTAFRRNPALGKCDPRSVFAAVIQASQLGLEPDTLGQAYLIPYGQECTFTPGWRGLVDLVNRAGRASVWSGAVFEGDEFDYALGDRPFLTHRPGDEDDESKLTHVYAIGRVKGSDQAIIEVWSKAKCLKHRDRYNKVGKRHYSFAHFEMYARKLVVLQVLKYLPSSAELAIATELSHAAETGSQGLTVKDAIDGTWAPVGDIAVPEANAEPEAIIASLTPADPQTGEMNPVHADWLTQIEDCRDLGEFARVIDDMPPPIKKALRGAMEAKQAQLKGAQ